MVKKIWNLNPKSYREWHAYCKNEGIYLEISKFLTHSNQTNLFNDVCQLMIFENFRNYKIEYRAKLYLEKLGFYVKKSFLVLDMFQEIDLLGYKNESKYIFQVKGNNVKKDFSKLINYSKINNYIPVLLIVSPDKIYWKNL